MNKQEALKLVEQMGEYEHFVDEPVSKKSVLNIINLRKRWSDESNS